MVDPHGFEHGRPDDGYRPLQLIGVIVVALLAFAVFFLSFLLAPLAILVVFYVGFSTADRSKRNGNSNGHHEAQVVVVAEPEATAPTVSSRTTLRSGPRPPQGNAELPGRAPAPPVPAPAPPRT